MNTDYNQMSNSQLINFINSTTESLAHLKKITIQEASYEIQLNSLISFLAAPNHQTSVEHLGLAPDQIDSNPQEDSLIYFRDIIKKNTGEKRQHILTNLEQLYPTIFQRLKDEITQQILHDESNKPDPYKEILDRLKSSIIGQEEAAKQLASELSSQRSKERNRIFLFVGPTGVGKTELAKTVAKVKDHFVIFAMNQYQSETDVTRFFGSSSGYVGSTDKPHFAKELDRCSPKFLQKEGQQRFMRLRTSLSYLMNWRKVIAF